MSLELSPIPTASYMQQALSYSSTGIKVDAQYIGVGEGLQAIQIDAAGRAITDTLKKPVAWLPILTAKKIGGYQHQMVVDFAGVLDREFNLSELVLGDENKKAIAIYGHPTQALMTISPVVDKALTAINMLLGTFPANSINIIHQGVPLELFMTAEIAAMDAAIGRLTLAQMQGYNTRRAAELAEAERRAAAEQQLQTMLADHQLSITQQLHEFIAALTGNRDAQQLFNITVEQGIGRLSLATMQ